MAILCPVNPNAFCLIESPLRVQGQQLDVFFLKEFEEGLAHDTVTVLQVDGALLPVIREHEYVPVILVMCLPSLMKGDHEAAKYVMAVFGERVVLAQVAHEHDDGDDEIFDLEFFDS